MHVEQAVFTSVRSHRNDGYQLAACSAGVSEDQQRELLHWGPAHDSLDEGRSSSINFHTFQDGCFCIAKTSQAGAEYSGRGGMRIYTQCLVVPRPLMERFANHPFRIMEAVVASGRIRLLDPIPKRLEHFRLVGRASPSNTSMLTLLTRELGADRLATMVSAAISTMQLAVVSPVPAERLFAATLDLLPPLCRTEFPFTTGLRHSPRRPFRWIAVSPRSEMRRRFSRMNNISFLDLCDDLPTRYLPEYGWPLLIWELLKKARFTEIANVLKIAQRSNEPNYDELAEALRDRMVQGQTLSVDALNSPPHPTADETAEKDTGCHEAPRMLRGGTGR